MDMYQEEILEHYKHPHNYGTLEHADVVQEEYNPLCGDKLTFFLQFQDGVVSDVRFSGTGCAISQAAASMMTDEIKGKNIQEVSALKPQDVLDLLGITLGPTRLKCALLSLQGLTHAVAEQKQTQKS